MDALARQDGMAGGADAVDTAGAGRGGDRAAGGNDAPTDGRTTSTRSACVGRAHAAGSGSRLAGWRGGLLDWCDDQIPNWASYLNSPRFGPLARQGVYLCAPAALANECRVDIALDCCARQGDSFRDGVGAVGMAAAMAAAYSDAAELALVAGGHCGVVAGGCVAGDILQRDSARNDNLSDLGYRVEAGCRIFAGRCKLDGDACLGGDAAFVRAWRVSSA